MESIYILMRYGILIDGSYRNEKKKIQLKPAEIDDYNFQVEKAFKEIVKRKTGQIIVEGIHSSGWPIVVMPYLGKDCNNLTNAYPEMHRGLVNVLIGFTPDQPCDSDPKSKEFKAGGTPAESLFHELVHAFRYVTEKGSKRKGPLNPYLPTALKNYPEYDIVEDFFAVLIANIFASETGRPLRANHDDLEALPSHLSTNESFLAVEEYARLVRQFCVDHTSVSQQFRDVPSAFNPIKEVLIGQGYQYLLNAR